MILTKNIDITINPSNFKHFKELGYLKIKKGSIINIPIVDLNCGSNYIINVKCDICGNEKKLSYRNYLKSFNNQNIYCCSSKCAKDKIENTNYNLYKTKYFSQTSIFKENIKNTCLKKYNTTNPSKCIFFQDKRKNTMNINHGVDYYVLSKDFRTKSEITSMKNYGTPHPMMSDTIKQRRKDFLIKHGFNVDDSKFKLYKTKIYRLTKKVKSQLLNMWNGLDYYDNENIQNNFNLPYYHKNYPTIDHKISIFDGFKNNIDPLIIADISNLCLTKRYINSKKSKNSYFNI